MHVNQVLMGRWWDGEHSDLGIVHALIVSNLDGTLDDVDVVLQLSDKPHNFGEKPVVVACLVSKVPPILRISQSPPKMVGSNLFSDLRMSSLMSFLRLLGQESGPSTLLCLIT